MNGKNHLKVAAVAGLAVAVSNGVQNSDLITLVLSAPIAGIAGLVPDVDSKNSQANQYLNKLTPFFLMVVAISYLADKQAFISTLQHPSRAMLGLFILIGYVLIGKNSTHRTFTHRFYGTAMFIVGVNFINPILGYYAVVGYVAHLLCDSLTVDKLDFLAPFVPFKFGIGLCGGHKDKHERKQNRLARTIIVILVIYIVATITGISRL